MGYMGKIYVIIDYMGMKGRRECTAAYDYPPAAKSMKEIRPHHPYPVIPSLTLETLLAAPEAAFATGGAAPSAPSTPRPLDGAVDPAITSASACDACVHKHEWLRSSPWAYALDEDDRRKERPTV